MVRLQLSQLLTGGLCGVVRLTSIKMKSGSKFPVNQHYVNHFIQ